REFGFDSSSVDVMILSHAHIDHCGLIPKLVKEGFQGRIFCTPATNELTKVLLLDSAEIQEDDVKYENKKRAASGQPYLRPIYTKVDAEKSFDQFVTAEDRKSTRLNSSHVAISYAVFCLKKKKKKK